MKSSECRIAWRARRIIQPLPVQLFGVGWLRLCLILAHSFKASIRGGWTQRSREEGLVAARRLFACGSGLSRRDRHAQRPGVHRVEFPPYATDTLVSYDHRKTCAVRMCRFHGIPQWRHGKVQHAHVIRQALAQFLRRVRVYSHLFSVYLYRSYSYCSGVPFTKSVHQCTVPQGVPTPSPAYRVAR